MESGSPCFLEFPRRFSLTPGLQRSLGTEPLRAPPCWASELLLSACSTISTISQKVTSLAKCFGRAVHWKCMGFPAPSLLNSFIVV